MMGESFGGLLAIAVAARMEVAGLALVNPATSWNRAWPSRIGVYSKVLPAPLVAVSGLVVLAAVGDRGTFTNLVDAALGRPVQGELDISEEDRCGCQCRSFRRACRRAGAAPGRLHT